MRAGPRVDKSESHLAMARHLAPAMSSPWQSLKNIFASSKKTSATSTRGNSSYPDYPYQILGHEHDTMARLEESESSRHGTDAAMAKSVLRKIDMRLIPLLFCTYMLNFMDKTILSSAAVFGLRDDTVRICLTLFFLCPPFTHAVL